MVIKLVDLCKFCKRNMKEDDTCPFVNKTKPSPKRAPMEIVSCDGFQKKEKKFECPSYPKKKRM